MSPSRGIRRLVRLFLRTRRAIERDVDEEVALHIELRTEQLRARGWDPDEARREAEQRFGRALSHPEDLYATAHTRERSMRWRERMEEWGTDLAYAMRGLRREPAFAAFIVVTLALGVGMNAAMFGIADRLLVRGPAHVVAPADVHRLYVTSSDVDHPGRSWTSSSLGYVAYKLLREAGRSVAAVAAYKIEVDGVVMDRGDDAQRINLGQSTAGFFPLLGVKPALGRFYTEADDDPNTPQHVAVIDHGLWQRRFGGRSDVIGAELRLGDVPYTVIGVAPRGFTGPELRRVDVWIPISLMSRRVTDDWQTTWNAQWLRVISRSAPGITDLAAGDDATRLLGNAARTANPDLGALTFSWRPIGFARSGIEAPETRISRWLVAVALIVLLTACFNVANLLVARVTRREREMAVRAALGSGAWRLTRMLLAEGIILSVLAGMVALIVAAWAGGLVRQVLLPDVLWTTPTIEPRVLAMTAIIVGTVALFTGLLPAWHSSRPDLTGSMQGDGRGGGASLRRLRGVLTVGQGAMSVVLLIGAGLFVRSLVRVQQEDLGIETSRVLVASARFVPLPADTAAARVEDERRDALYARALERVRDVPGVERASLAVGTPFGSSFGVDLRVAGWDSLPGGAYVSAVTPGYFEGVGTRRLRGRTFEPSDRAGSEPVAVVNETMARTLWPGREPLGECLFIGRESPPCARIVGIVADARQNAINEVPSMHYYIPFGQERGFGGTQLIVRPAGDPTALIPALRTALMAVDASLLYVDIEVMDRFLEEELRPWRLGASLFVLMGLLALVVASVGLYSVMSYFVAQRTREIGLRLALGSPAWRLVRLVVGGSVGLAVVGILLGSVIALGGTRYLDTLLYKTSPRDPLVFVVSAGVLLTMSVLAALVPAWRARGVDPMVALRAE